MLWYSKEASSIQDDMTVGKERERKSCCKTSRREGGIYQTCMELVSQANGHCLPSLHMSPHSGVT
jgi:hypothetical protein